jgi:hypothetical protein
MTIQEIEALTEYQKNVFKDVFMTKEDGQKLEGKIDNIQTTLDGLAMQTKSNGQELAVLNNRMKRAEDWIDKASPKVGVKFEH